jgi:hypothetical protein
VRVPRLVQVVVVLLVLQLQVVQVELVVAQLQVDLQALDLRVDCLGQVLVRVVDLPVAVVVLLQVAVCLWPSHQGEVVVQVELVVARRQADQRVFALRVVDSVQVPVRLVILLLVAVVVEQVVVFLQVSQQGLVPQSWLVRCQLVRLVSLDLVVQAVVLRLASSEDN